MSGRGFDPAACWLSRLSGLYGRASVGQAAFWPRLHPLGEGWALRAAPWQETGGRRGRSLDPVIVWHRLSDPDTRFHHLGSCFYDTRICPDRKKRNQVHQLEALGFKVTLEPAA